MKLETLSQVVFNAKSILKEFKSKHMLVDLLSNMQKQEKVHIALKLPVKTRWGSISMWLESVQKNKLVLRKVVVSEISETTNLSKDIKKIILDDAFWESNAAMAHALSPLFVAITNLEADEPNLADVYEIYCNIEEQMIKVLPSTPFTDAERQVIKGIFSKRKEFCIHIVHKAAYMLDPRHHGLLLCDDDRVAAIEFICKFTENLAFCGLNVNEDKVQENLALFSAKEGFLAKYFFGKMWKRYAQLLGGKGFAQTKS